MYLDQNIHTQPVKAFSIFNNDNVVPEAWYIVCRSSELAPKELKELAIGVGRIVLFRGESGKLAALDAFCPHMGTRFKIGSVVGDEIRCFFHHWHFAANGSCTKVPAEGKACPRVKTKAYLTAEKYGFIWVHPNYKTKDKLLEIPELGDQELLTVAGRSNLANSHHHISMINGLDAQHLRSVHKIQINMSLSTSKTDGNISFVMSGKTPCGNWTEKTMRFLFGPNYSYAMTYSKGTLASLSLLRNVYFLSKRWRWPQLYMFFAYRPLPDGRSLTIPIFVAPKGKGLWGRVKAKLRIFLTQIAYRFLQDEDQIIYDNIRFNPQNLIRMDHNLWRLFEYIESLQPSIWSRHLEALSDET